MRKPDGGPAAAAIVRIEDWYETARGDAATAVPAVVRTDADGRFTFPRVSPGRWPVRAESPGGECEQFIDLAPGKNNVSDLTLRAVTTVGLRWVLQTRELAQDFAGPGAQTGEAFFSVSSSRLSLARGLRLRMSEACDLMLAQTPLDDESLPEETACSPPCQPAPLCGISLTPRIRLSFCHSPGCTAIHAPLLRSTRSLPVIRSPIRNGKSSVRSCRRP